MPAPMTQRFRQALTRAFLLLIATAWLTGCKTTEEGEVGDLTHEMRGQMNATRAQLRASGASAKELREFDQAMQQLEKSMRAMEKQLKRLEREMK